MTVSVSIAMAVDPHAAATIFVRVFVVVGVVVAVRVIMMMPVVMFVMVVVMLILSVVRCVGARDSKPLKEQRGADPDDCDP